MTAQNIHIGNVTIPLNDFAITATGMLGIRKSGKTYGAKGIAEQLMDANVPIIVFDAIGVWRHLKTPGDGSKAKGYPIVVAGGEHPDLPLTPHSAPQIVRAAMRENVSLVIDLYSPTLSKADWRRIVTECFRILLYENKHVRHVFLEEAAEYAPQQIRGELGTVYAAVESFVRMGGNKGLGITLINQRSQEINKAVLELCDNLVLMRQRGSHAIDAVEKWMDKASPDVAEKIAKSLPHMTQGEAWVWTEANEQPILTKTHTIRTFHPDRREMGAVEVSRKSVDSGQFVSKLSGELEKVLEEAKVNDPSELKRKIAELQKELNAKPAAVKSVPVEIQVPVVTDDQLNRLNEFIGSIDRQTKMLDDVAERLEIVRSEAVKLRGEIVGRSVPSNYRPAAATKSHHNPAPAPRRVAASSNDAVSLPDGERRILTAIAQCSDGVERDQLTILTGYKRSTRDAYVQRLAGKGFVDVGVGQGRIMATQAGVDALGSSFEPLPTGNALREYWIERLPQGESAILYELVKAYPSEVDRDVLTESTGFKRSTRDAYLQRLASRRLVVNVGRGAVKASGILFEE